MKKKIATPLIMALSLVLIFSNSCKKNDPSPGSTKIAIGQTYQGGMVAYLLQPGDIGYDSAIQHGLIVAPSDQSAGMLWSTANMATQSLGRAIGTGKPNTAIMISKLGTSGNSASACTNLSLGGYSDWYLPSLGELDSIICKVGVLSGFNSDLYWSSTEYNDSVAVCQEIAEATANLGTYWICPKSAGHRVRAIRSF